MRTTLDKTELHAALEALGFSLRIDAGPVGGVDFHDQSDWAHIAFNVELLFNGKPLLVDAQSKTYKMCTGHVDVSKAKVGTTTQRWTPDEKSMIYAWQKNRHANWKNKHLHADVAAKLAKQQKVTPELTDILHCHLRDGEPFFNAQSFENWAGDLGYDIDSRKAEGIYRQCMEVGRKLKAGVPEDVLAKARELLQDY